MIIPVQCEYMALEGLSRLMDTLELVRRNLNPPLRIFGVVLTMFDGRTKLSQQVVDEVRGYFGDRVYQTVIPRTVRLSEAPSFGQPITLFDPQSRGSRAYQRLAREMAERLALPAAPSETSALDRLLAGDAHVLPESRLRDFGRAPDFQAIEGWLNSEPLTLAGLRGKVVLIDFWTYSCINCLRTLPYVKRWAETYRDSGLVVVGVHTPEFAFERVPENVERAVDSLGIRYPVVLDYDYATWTAWGNRYWPAKYFIDRQGHVRFAHFGEGEYEQSENVIRTLLAEEALPDPVAGSIRE